MAHAQKTNARWPRHPPFLTLTPPRLNCTTLAAYYHFSRQQQNFDGETVAVIESTERRPGIHLNVFSLSNSKVFKWIFDFIKFFLLLLVLLSHSHRLVINTSCWYNTSTYTFKNRKRRNSHAIVCISEPKLSMTVSHDKLTHNQSAIYFPRLVSDTVFISSRHFKLFWTLKASSSHGLWFALPFITMNTQHSHRKEEEEKLTKIFLC